MLAHLTPITMKSYVCIVSSVGLTRPHGSPIFGFSSIRVFSIVRKSVTAFAVHTCASSGPPVNGSVHGGLGTL